MCSSIEGSSWISYLMHAQRLIEVMSKKIHSERRKFSLFVTICPFVIFCWPPLRSSGQSSWLQIQRTRVRYLALQIFWEVGLERGPLSLVSTIEKLVGRNSSGSSLENREYGRVDPLRWPRDTLYPQKLALTSPTSGGRSVGILRLRTKATEFAFCHILFHSVCN
jgi:hypothetical protein